MVCDRTPPPFESAVFAMSDAGALALAAINGKVMLTGLTNINKSPTTSATLHLQLHIENREWFFA